jgi:hypothetical protein
MARVEVEVGAGMHGAKSAKADDTLAAFDFAWGPSPLYGRGTGVTITYGDSRFADKVTKVFLDVQILAVAYTVMLLQVKAGLAASGKGEGDHENS